ncbi:MAG: hypothetical protein PHW02_00245 [bacterium]|nr:hypothetical protein [bacterium]
MAKLKKNTKLDFKQKSNETSMQAGYEWLMRYSGIKTSENFQKKYFTPEESFEITSEKIMKDYPELKIRVKIEEDGGKKIERIKKLIDGGTPCLFALNVGRDNWHVFPVIGYDDDARKLIMIEPSGSEIKLDYEYIKEIHKKHSRNIGHEVSWIE